MAYKINYEIHYKTNYRKGLGGLDEGIFWGKNRSWHIGAKTRSVTIYKNIITTFSYY
jgi:hypothetical protein